MIKYAARGGFSKSVGSWIRSTHGSSSIEFVIGAVLVLTATVGGLDLYRTIGAQAAALRAATTMAEYMSLETAPHGAFIDDLAAFSLRHEIAMPADAAFVVTAVSRPEATDAEPDPVPLVRWSRKIAVGEDPESPPVELSESCGKLGESGSADTELLATLEMAPEERIVVVEVCVKLLPRALVSGRMLSGNVFPMDYYQHRIFPVQGDALPSEPL